MDYEEILKSVPKYHTRPPKKITKDELLAKATAMAKRGYLHSDKTLEVLEAYLQGYGILLSGGLGIGKTLFFEKVNPKPIAVLSFNRCYLWTADALGEWLDQYRNEEIVLDDLGWDKREARKTYGQEFETLQYVLDARLTLSNARTHITTNNTNEELIARYDPHLVDRIYQLCKCFALPSCESKRDAKINWGYVNNKEYQKSMGREEL